MSYLSKKFVPLISWQYVDEREAMWMPVLKKGVFKDPPKFKSSLPGDNLKTKKGFSNCQV